MSGDTRGAGRYKGVRRNPEGGGFHVRLRAGGKQVEVGNYASARAAAVVYDALARRVLGPWAACNFAEGEAPVPEGVDVDALLAGHGLLVDRCSTRRYRGVKQQVINFLTFLTISSNISPVSPASVFPLGVQGTMM